MPEEENEENEENEIYYSEDSNSEEEGLNPHWNFMRNYFGDEILGSSDEEEYIEGEEFDFQLVNNPRIQVLSSEEEEEEMADEKKKVNLIPSQNIKKATKADDNQKNQSTSPTKTETSKKSKRKLEEQVVDKKASTKKAKKKVDKESDLYLSNSLSKGVLLNGNFKKIQDYYVRDLTGSHEERIKVGSLIYLYCDIYDNNHSKLYSSDSNPVIFRVGINKVIDFIDKAVAGMRWNCLKLFKIPTLKLSQARQEFFKKYFNLKITPTEKKAYVYVKACPLQKLNK